jgi:hypothetical protein
MNAMSLNEWILAATLTVAAVVILITLGRLIRTDGYGLRNLPDPRGDWGTPTRPSLPYSTASRL